MKITKEAHLDHGLTERHVLWLSTKTWPTHFFIATVDIPDHLPEVTCGLYGPAMGDTPVSEGAVIYTIRGTRKCASRTIALPKRTTRKLTVIGGPHGEEPCILYTAYGGPAAPREPGDTTIKTWEEVLAARAFWAEHALSSEG